jgi:hypothetical protein
LPTPSLVSDPKPEITPEKVVEEPSPPTLRLFVEPGRTTLPEPLSEPITSDVLVFPRVKVAVPLTPRGVKSERVPCPDKVSDPAETMVAPLYVLAPLRTSSPELNFVNPKRPLAPPSEITPERDSRVPPTSIVLFAPSVTAPLRLLIPVLVFSVPPFRVIASAPTATPCKSNVATFATVVLFPAIVPRPLALLIANVPLLIVVLPE